MMNLELVRYGYGDDSTLGRLYRLESESRVPLCWTLEDERRDVKVPGETCIPVGTYEITLRTKGRLHQKYLRRFPEMHEGMLWLRRVPDFRWVYIHIGNTDDDTEGCPLVGELPASMPDGEFEVHRSVAAYKKVYPPIAEALSSGERVVLTVRER